MKDVFTTGEVAKICRLSPQTVINYFESGELQGYKTPKSNYRRITRKSLTDFMQRNNIPSEFLEQHSTTKILIVDDDVQLVEMIENVFKEETGYETHSVNRGFDAGTVLSLLPDIILLDIFLPDIDGFQVCSYIRENPATKDIKIIGISGYITEDEERKLSQRGFDDFLRKPFSIDALLEKVRKYAKRD